MEPWFIPISIATAIVGPVLTYFVARRKAAGRVAVTEAETLWRESGDFRRDLQERIKVLEAKVDVLMLEASSLHTEVISLRAENRLLRESLEMTGANRG